LITNIVIYLFSYISISIVVADPYQAGSIACGQDGHCGRVV